MLDRRRLLVGLGAATALPVSAAARDATIELPLSDGSGVRPLTTGFPQKGTMILQRARPALLETPFEVFDKSIYTPNDRFFVRWHWGPVPSDIDTNSFRFTVRGNVDRTLSLSLKDLRSFPEFEITAVNQCSGNSRGLSAPRVPGAQWGNGAMGNARWTGIRLRDLLDRAGIKAGTVQARFSGLDDPVVPTAPKFLKSLQIDHARDGEVMIAYAMNGRDLPLLNGFPLRLVVPGWYSTYWIKMLNDIEILTAPDENFWMKSAYLIPDTPGGSVAPGQTGFPTVPINKMVPRSFVTNVTPGTKLVAGRSTRIRGIAMGGDTGVSKVEISTDGGASWQASRLGQDAGKYSFRLWEADLTLGKGEHALMVRCTNNASLVQPDRAGWNPSGFMRNVIETTTLSAV
jgi:DMSO/TMAO reductase YedYZ molybdopterin-dependent catalytic subunit